MQQRVDGSSPLLKASVILGLWTMVVLLISSITLLSVIQEGMSMSIPVIIYYEFLCMSPWIVLTPGIVWLARRYSFTESMAFLTFAVHFTAMVFVFVVHTLVQSYTVSVQYNLTLTWGYLQRDFLGFLDMRLMLYLGILLVVYSIDFHRKNREVGLREPRLRADLNRAKFQALLNNIQPDFMLNTIGLIKEKLQSNVDEAEEVLTDFSDLLRLMLNSPSKDELPVHEDIRVYHLYVNILQKREVPAVEKKVIVDPNCYDAIIPSFLILIPVLENMICHGNKTGQKITAISYEVRKAGERMHLQTVMEGVRLDDFHRVGLKNGMGENDMMEHLELKYGSGVDFTMQTSDVGFVIKLMIPFRKEERGRSSKMVAESINHL